MPHAPMPYTLLGIYLVATMKIGGDTTLVYTFEYNPYSICYNVFIFMVLTNDGKIRFFAVETDYAPYVLCEYLENRHINYGRIELRDCPRRIEEILKNEKRENKNEHFYIRTQS